MRLLIANHGMSATKLCLSLGCRKDLTLIGIVSDQDLESNFQYIKMVHETVRKAGRKYDGIYMNIQQLIHVAKEVKADGVLPGWGYLSEYAEFAEAVEKAGMLFIGPSPKTLASLGDKIECSVLADQLKVPTIPWSGEKQIESVEDVKEAIKVIGLPVMIKASLGGGGRGIRPVFHMNEVESQWNTVRAEVEGPIFVMRLVKTARHLEVQLVGDGKVVKHLHTRDCSVQRKNQKLIEEGPATIAPEVQLMEMCRDACRFGEAVCLRGLATAEFLYDPETKEYYFLEVNPRLQVEHVITEMMYGGLNLPSMLVDLCSGKHVCQDFECLDKKPLCHTISIRVCAEEMENEFRPSTGRINRVEYNPTTSHEWGYFSIVKGLITGKADNQFGHLFASGDTREQAIDRLVESIHRLTIVSECAHTSKTLKSVLSSSCFRNENQHHTKWLASTLKKTGVEASQKSSFTIPLVERVIAGICWKAKETMLEQKNGFLEMKKRGHPPPGNRSLVKTLHRISTCVESKVYTFDCMMDLNLHRIFIQPVENWDSSTLWLECHFEVSSIPSTLLLTIAPIHGEDNENVEDSIEGGHAFLVREINRKKSHFKLMIGGETCEYYEAIDTREIRSPVGGRITMIHSSGDDKHILSKGTSLLDIEVMKMNITISMPVEGTVSIQPEITIGAYCETDQLLYVIEEVSDGTESSNTPWNNPIQNDDEVLSYLKQKNLIQQENITSQIDASIKSFLNHWTKEMNGHVLERRVSSRSNLSSLGMVEETKQTQMARSLANKHCTTYIQDIPLLFSQVGNCLAIEPPTPSPEIFDFKGDIGTACWCFQTKHGKNFLLLANDVTLKGGSFGTEEAKMFVNVCKYAQKNQVPFVFWSANAGARMGSPEMLKSVIRADKSDDNRPYLYVLDEDYQRLNLKDELIASSVQVSNEIRWKIDSITGFPGIGVENLSWSGAMAREMVSTRESGFTLSYVSGRSVGIGAYLNKLGERIIQKNDSPLLLTGAGALNQLYCHDVYNGNHELGGPGVMERNGISHSIVESDEEGVLQIVRWIDGYLPGFEPQSFEKNMWTAEQFRSKQYDIKEALRSVLDSNSFLELWPLWGSSIVCGRGMLSEKKVGIIAAQCQPTVSIHQTVDPAHPDSLSVSSEHPGNVLFADSSAKVARCLEDCRLENIPVILFANIRGFSGDTTEMFRAVLTHGSNIVNSLTRDGPPVYVYVPPFGTLRGGSYVVFTPTINPSRMTLLLDPRSSVGILEPNASSAFVWKKKDHQSMMERCPEAKMSQKEIGELLSSAQDQPSRCVRLVPNTEILAWENFNTSFTTLLQDAHP